MRPPCSILIAIGRVFLGAGSVAVRANFNGVFLFFACLVPVAAVCLLQFPLLWLAVCTLWLSVCMVACATFVPAVLRRDPLSDHAVPSVPSRPPLSQSFGCTRPPAALAHRRCCTLDHPPCDGNRRERNAVECAGGRGDTTTLHPLRPLLAHLTRCRCLSRRCRSLHRQLHTHTHTHILTAHTTHESAQREQQHLATDSPLASQSPPTPLALNDCSPRPQSPTHVQRQQQQ